MFNLRGLAFRFGNVVGSRQTHGVAFDFLKRLKVDPSKLDILGDGTQSKSYIDVDDVISAVLLARERSQARFDCYNVATGDYITVTEIAELAIGKSGIAPGSVKFVFSGGDRGWKGDVPIVRIDIEKIQSLGWKCRRTSKEAIAASIDAMLAGQ
jgi:UDP-glucose 4-epimerase